MAEYRIDPASDLKPDWHEFIEAAKLVIATWPQEVIIAFQIFLSSFAMPKDGTLRIIFGRSEWTEAAWHSAATVQNGRRINKNGLTAVCTGEDHLPARVVRIFGFPPEANADNWLSCEQLLAEIIKKLPRELTAEETAARYEANRDAFIKESAGRLGKVLQETEKAAAEKKSKAAELLANYIRTQREAEGQERKLRQIQAENRLVLDGFGSEYDTLVRCDKVKRVEVAPGMIKVFTTTIYCLDDRSGKVHELGEFRIDIPTTSNGGGVTMWNQTHKPGDKNAPHVGSNGRPCLGTAATGFAQALGKQQYAMMGMMAINYLAHANTSDSAGRSISTWPLAPEHLQPGYVAPARTETAAQAAS